MPRKRKEASHDWDTASRYDTAEDLQKACDAYFAKCDQMGLLYGEAGLALHLGVTLTTLRSWYDGNRSAHLQNVTQMAYMKIQEQVESDPRYQEKGMVTRGIFLNKQMRLGGYQDKVESKSDISVNVKMGENMDESDFK